MLFHIKQSHEPRDCPYGKGGSRSLFDSESKDVKIHGYWLAFPQHTIYLVVETDDIVHLQKFLQPGAGVTVAEITPVRDQPVPSPPRPAGCRRSGRPGRGGSAWRGCRRLAPARATAGRRTGPRPKESPRRR